MTGWQWLGAGLFALFGLAAMYGIGAEDGMISHRRRLVRGASIFAQIIATFAVLIGLPIAFFFLAFGLLLGEIP